MRGVRCVVCRRVGCRCARADHSGRLLTRTLADERALVLRRLQRPLLALGRVELLGARLVRTGPLLLKNLLSIHSAGAMRASLQVASVALGGARPLHLADDTLM